MNKHRMVLFPFLTSLFAAFIYINLNSVKRQFALNLRVKWLLISVVLSQVAFYVVYAIFAEPLVKLASTPWNFLIFPTTPKVFTIACLKVLQSRAIK